MQARHPRILEQYIAQRSHHRLLLLQQIPEAPNAQLHDDAQLPVRGIGADTVRRDDVLVRVGTQRLETVA